MEACQNKKKRSRKRRYGRNGKEQKKKQAERVSKTISSSKKIKY